MNRTVVIATIVSGIATPIAIETGHQGGELTEAEESS